MGIMGKVDSDGEMMASDESAAPKAAPSCGWGSDSSASRAHLEVDLYIDLTGDEPEISLVESAAEPSTAEWHGVALTTLTGLYAGVVLGLVLVGA